MLRRAFRSQWGRAIPEGWQWRHGLSKRFARSTYELLTEAQLIRVILEKLRKFHFRRDFRTLDETRSPWRNIEPEHLQRQPGETPLQWRHRLEQLAVDLFYNDPAYIWAGPGHYNMLLGRLLGGGRNPVLDLDLPFRWNMEPGPGPLGRYGPRSPYDLWREAEPFMRPKKTIGPGFEGPGWQPPPQPAAPKTIGGAPERPALQHLPFRPGTQRIIDGIVPIPLGPRTTIPGGTRLLLPFRPPVRRTIGPQETTEPTSPFEW